MASRIELESGTMWWELSSVFDGVRDEYLGWRNFKNATGKWPFWSVLSGVVSIPIVVAIGAYCLVAALQTRRLVLIYGVLFSIVVCGAIVWYLIRRAARVADVARAKRKAGQKDALTQLENFLR